VRAIYDPFSHAIQDDPWEVYRRLRDEHPVYHNTERDIWVLSRFADVDAAVREPGTFSSERGVSFDRRSTEGMVPMLLTLDPPRHDELRRLVSRAFTPRSVADLEPRIRDITRALLDDLASGDGFDAMDLASALPTIVIAEMLGVPSTDKAMFRSWVETVITVDPAVIGARKNLNRIGELFMYLGRIIEERRAAPRHDLISGLIEAEVDGERLSPPELLGFIFLLLVAGFETTKNLIGNGTWLLGTYPDARERLVEDPDLVPRAVEEILRFESPVVGLARTTTRSVTLHDVVIPAGAVVQMNYASANRDERVFPEPDVFDIDRATDRHLAFGQGIHFCLGAALARLEGRVAFEELLARAPAYRVVDPARLYSPYIRGFASLPVARS
jgi:cytochrome P450